MMQIDELCLAPELDFWISSSCYFNYNIAGKIPYVHAFPEATPELIILLDGYFLAETATSTSAIHKSCIFTSTTNSAVGFIPSNHVRAVQLVFQPFGVLPIHKLAMKRATPQELNSAPYFDAVDILGPSFLSLEAQLKETTDPQEITKLVSNYFFQLYYQQIEATDQLLLTHFQRSIYNVDILCDELALSPRTLQRWFKKNMNVPPKYYLRLLRFKKLLQEISHNTTPDYNTLALKYQFYDQNHLIKEFKHFTSLTPKSAPINRHNFIQTLRDGSI